MGQELMLTIDPDTRLAQALGAAVHCLPAVRPLYSHLANDTLLAAVEAGAKKQAAA